MLPGIGGVTFVDGYGLPTPGVAATEGRVNLPLLTGLLPCRYPRAIDPATLRGREPFRSFRSNIASGGKAVVVPLVQFTGPVGQGDRCVRSDRPFPRSRTLSRYVDDSSDTDAGAASGGFGGGLSSWIKNYAPRGGRRDGHRGVRPSGSGSALLSDDIPRLAESVTEYSTTGMLVSDTEVPPLDNISSHSPLYQFVSSLFRHSGNSRHSFSTASSSSSVECRCASVDGHDRSQGITDKEGGGTNDGIDRNEYNGHNYYGVPALRRSLFHTCKRRLGDGLSRRRHHFHNSDRAARHHAKGDELCPFVVPIVVAYGGDNIQEGRRTRTVDLTPRLVRHTPRATHSGFNF